jgi:hypothetical protein
VLIEGPAGKEIARRLFLTVRTMEIHLCAAYRKLDVGSRCELPAVFATAINKTAVSACPSRRGARAGGARAAGGVDEDGIEEELER